MKLFSEFKIGNLAVKNRIVMPPMCMYSAYNGVANEFHEAHYEARALGGVGLIIVEASAVMPNGRISERDLGLWEDAQASAHAKIVAKIKKHGAIACVQLAHAGAKSEVASSEPFSPSGVRFSDVAPYKTPKAMSKAEIDEVKNAFINAALRAQNAGYQAVEIHAAHGYLLNEFLSLKQNLRDDEYGKDRAKLLLEILSEIRAKTSLEVGVRLSASSWQSGDYGVADMVELASRLEASGASFIDVSSGGLYPAPDTMPHIAALYQAGYAKQIKSAVKIPVIAVGLITTGAQGEALLMGEMADAVAYGRSLLANPNLTYVMMSELRCKELIPRQYQRMIV